MSGKIENLGDYNNVRIDLQKCGGDMDALYKKIGDERVAEVAPWLLGAGAVTVIAFRGIVKGAGKLIKKWKELINSKPELKEKFNESVQNSMTEETDTTENVLSP